MTSDDCYVLAMQLNLMDQHALAVDWLKESLKRISNKSSIKENLVILDRLASAYTTMGNNKMKRVVIFTYTYTLFKIKKTTSKH